MALRYGLSTCPGHDPGNVELQLGKSEYKMPSWSSAFPALVWAHSGLKEYVFRDS